MSFVAGTSEFSGIAAKGVEVAWKLPLALLIGAYSLERQHSIIVQQLDVADRQVALGEQYVNIARSQYDAISTPTFQRLTALYNRWASSFSGYEIPFLNAALSQLKYVPDYKLAEGRAVGHVQTQLDNAHTRAQRATSKYATGRRRWTAYWYQVKLAQARVDASDTGYRFEEERMKWFLQFYWQRYTAAAHVMDGIAHNVVIGLTGGSNQSANGIRNLGHAFDVIDKGYDMVQGALANQANFWGSVANGAFKATGYSMGAAPIDVDRGLGSWEASVHKSAGAHSVHTHSAEPKAIQWTGSDNRVV